MTNAEAPILIDASPTKDFFISILVRDIKLADAIADLVDNCVDGARRLRENGDFKGLRIDVEFDKDHFSIMDNCGGIPVKVAREYAFRFGRPENMPQTKRSVGQFGVGMKRALFKMGEYFLIESTEPEAKFEVEVDVQKWRSSFTENGREKWEFEFKGLREGEKNPPEICGTIISVEKLYPAISEEFGSKLFESRVLDAIQSAHEQSIHQGLEIQINKHQIQHRLSTLLVSDSIRPLKIEKAYTSDGGPNGKNSEVRTTIYAGISDSVLEHAGWYVVCNGRQVLRADKSKTVGWDEVVNDVKIPKAHYQFARFRGFVFFESDDASALPWNTMKNAVDPESRVYQAAKLEMSLAMRQVIDFLNKLDAEADSESSGLSNAVQSSTAQPLSSITVSTTFVYPDGNITRTPPTTQKIIFSRPIEEIAFAKDYFKVSTAKAAGEKSFDYFLEREKV
jgi:hypothetical protein